MEENKKENIKNENKKEEQKINSLKQSKKRWWKYFWGTIIVFIVFYISVVIKGYLDYKIKDNKRRREVVLEDVVRKLQKYNINIIKLVYNINDKTKLEIKNMIKEQVDKLYSPVYSNVDEFVNFHYTLKGEYSELAVTLTNKLNSFIYDHIFKPANFDENYNKTLTIINKHIEDILKKEFSQIKSNLNEFNFTNEESEVLLLKVLHYSQEDMIDRFKNYKYAGFRGVGIVSGGAMGVLMSKILAKKIAKKLLVKIGVKVTTKVAAAASGAAIGAESGVACGTFAVLCSPAGAIIGGIVGWFASDKILIEVDKYFNSDKFKKEIINMINQQKNQLTNILINIYLGSVDKVNKDLIKSISSLKNKPIKDIIKQ